MGFLKNTFWVKRFIGLICLSIVCLILWNTYVFFQEFKKDERTKIENYAIAIKELANNQNINNNAELPFRIIQNTKNIPFIIVKFNGELEYRNLDTIKAKNPEYLKKQLAIMKSQNKPIKVKFLKKTDYIYYKDSLLLNKLTYYPLALILILILFLGTVYMVFTSNKIADQNKLWTGMAKETAHQIGTPLSSLLGWIAILKMEKVNDKYVEEIEKDVNRLNTIANRFSKIGSKPELKTENLIAVTKKAFDYLKSRSSKQITFSFQSEVTDSLVLLNKELFGWVIENLIKNAIDAMQGKGNLDLTIAEKEKKIVLTFTDTGKGIAKKEFKQIFKPGFTTKKRGWGLGLSLSKRIIEDYHNGKIFVVKSEINKGSTFQIQLNKA